MRKIISRTELNKEFRNDLVSRGLVSASATDYNITATPLAEVDEDGANWTNITFRAPDLDISDILPIIQSLRYRFNVDFSKK